MTAATAEAPRLAPPASDVEDDEDTSRSSRGPLGEVKETEKVGEEEGGDHHDDGDKEDEEDSADEALCEMLGLSSMSSLRPPADASGDDDDDNGDGFREASPTVALSDGHQSSEVVPNPSEEEVDDAVERSGAREEYESDGVCVLPEELSVPAGLMRRITEELVWGGGGGGGLGGEDRRFDSDRTYETVRVLRRERKRQQEGAANSNDVNDDDDDVTTGGDVIVEERRTLTRLERFVHSHSMWSSLCHGHLARCVSALCGEPMLLFKEKLNVKPPGGSGFAPHLDSPSLRLSLGESGPQTFVTVMVAIDDMTERNGCLRLARGRWSEERHVEVDVPPTSASSPSVVVDDDGENLDRDNPDGGGRAGAIPPDIADKLDFEPLICRGGTVAVFGGWTPHRSAPNASHFARRAVFLTYHPEREGTGWRERYYDAMGRLREEYRERMRRKRLEESDSDWRNDLDALGSIPRI